MYNVNMKKMSLYLPEQQLDALNALSERDGIFVSEHIRRALHSYLSTVGHTGICACGDNKLQLKDGSHHRSKEVAS